VLVVSAIVAKLFAGSQPLVLDLALFIANLVLLGISLEIMRRFGGRKRKLAEEERGEPLAQPGRISA